MDAPAFPCDLVQAQRGWDDTRRALPARRHGAAPPAAAPVGAAVVASVLER
ncbi:hypothetical protein [Streptomyces sp. NPDC058394]|uniref:hypothetical protein n=1 Tax=Streptomyces sp. NPDC058394 TaxID=3346477 RepID=UPI0036564A35